MLNSLRDGQINYGTTNCPSVHVPPHNVAPIHQNSHISTEPATSVYPWNSNPRLEHLYGFHSRYYNIDFPTPYPPATNQYVPANMYGQNMSQCCQPCCRLRSQSIPKVSPPQVLYNQIRPVQQLNRSCKSKKTLKSPCSEQFLPYIPNDFSGKYDTQNCYQQKYSSSYLSNTNYCPPSNNLWIPPVANTTWSTDRLRPLGHHSNVASYDFNRDKNYQRLPNYQSNQYSNPIGARPYNYISPIRTDIHDYRSSVYHNPLKSNTSEYISHGHNSRLPISSQNNQSPPSLQQYYNTQSVPYSNSQRHNEPLKPPAVTSQNSLKSNLNVREFLATWDEEEEDVSEKSSEVSAVPAPIVVLDCMTLEGDALTKIQEKLNVVSYENLEKVLKENQNPLIINTEPNENDSIQNKVKPPSKSNFEPLDYTKRETGIIKPFITDKKLSPETNEQSEKSYSVNFDGMVAWYGKKNTDISSTDLIERLADRIFNLSKSQENEGVSFGTAAYTGQITQTNRAIASSAKDSSKYIQSQQLFGLQHAEKYIEPSVINKMGCNNDIVPRTQSCVSNESEKTSTDIKSNNINSSCIVENITKKYLNVTNEQTTPWNLDQNAQEQHLNLSLYDHSVIIKPLDFSSLTDETKCNPFSFEKNLSSGDKPNDGINDQFNKVLIESNNYNTTVSNDQNSVQQIDSSNRNFPVIVSPHNHRQDYNGFHESVIQRTGCDKNKHEKISTHTDFDGMNWNMSNDFDKIIKNTNIDMESSCLYDRNNYSILDNMNANKNVSTQWKNNIPCIDLTVSSKTNSSHDTFFDGWNFIENYDNHSIKKIVNSPSNNNEVNNPLFTNQITSLDKSNIKNNDSGEKVESEYLGPVKDISFSKNNIMASNNMRSRDVFNLNNRIPDFSDGFELPVINVQNDYMSFKKGSNDNENRADGSIFEHLSEPKFVRTLNETTNSKIDVHKSDIVGLPSFKEKEPLAPMPVPLKLNVVKPIIRDPSQIYTVIKQKMKYDNACANTNNMVSNKTGNDLRDNETNNFNVTDLKSKYNGVQLNQFDVWSEKFTLKGNLNNSSTAVVQCDVEITQFKSTPENRNTLASKLNICENNQDKNLKLPENTDCNLTMNKINVIENEKINSNDFLNCLENTKTDDQKYRETLDEFETSFGFDIHCSNETNKSFHEDIVDKCLEERIKDQIGGHNINTSNTTSSNNTQMPFQCDFQSSYLIKNYFDENKNKAVVLDHQIQSRHHEKSNIADFNFDLHNNHNIHINQNSKDNPNFNILNDTNHNIEKIHNVIKENNSNFINKTELKHSFESNHDNIDKMSDIKKNDFDYFTMDERNFEFENNKKCVQESTDSKNINDINNLTEANNVCKISHNSFSNTQKNISNDFELNINNINMYETNSNIKSKPGTNEGHELEHDKNSFVSTFHSSNAKNIEQHKKHIFELENNTSELNNLGKMHAFDFSNRSIQSFDMNCSHNNARELITPEKIFTNENLIKTNYNYDINNKENNVLKDENLKNTSFIHKVPQTDETLVLETNVISENKIVSKTGSITNNIDEKQIPRTNINAEFDFLNENSKEIKINNCNTHVNSNTDINEEVENIFEHLYDNLNTLSTEKDNSNNCCQNDVSNSIRNIENQNLKIDNVVIDQNHKNTQINECYKSDEISEKTNNVFKLQEFVNNSVSHLSTFSLRQNESLLEKNNINLMLKDTKKTDKYISNKNENFLNISNKPLVCENTTMYKEHDGQDIKQINIESKNQNNMQHIKNKIVNKIQNEATRKKIENIKSDLLNTVISTNKTQAQEHIPDNSSMLSSINYDKLVCQQYYNEMVAVNDLSMSGHSPDKYIDVSKSRLDSINHNKLTYQQHLNHIVEVKDSPKSETSSGKYDKLLHRLNLNAIVKTKDLLKYELNSLKHGELIYQQHHNKMDMFKNTIIPECNLVNHVELTNNKYSDETIEIEDSPIFETSLINHGESTYKQHSNDSIETEDSPKFGTSLMLHSELTHKQHSNETTEVENTPKFETSLINHSELAHNKHTNESTEVEDSPKFEISLINQVELTHKQHSNETNEVENSPKLETSLINHGEMTHKQHSIETIEIEDSPKFETCLISHGETICKEHVIKTIEIEDSPKFETCLISHGETTCKEHSIKTIEVEDSPKFETSLINHGELTNIQHTNENTEVEDSPKFETSLINHGELTNKQHTNESTEVEDSSKFEISLINHGELSHKQHSNEKIDVEKSPKFETNLINHGEFINDQHSNDIIQFEDSSKFETSLINHDECINDQHSNDIIQFEDSPKFETSLINHSEFTHDQYSNEIIKIEDSPIFKTNLKNHGDLTLNKHTNESTEVEDSPKFETSLINHSEFTHNQHSNETTEVENTPKFETNLINHGELTHNKHTNESTEVEDSSKFETSSIKQGELTHKIHTNESIEVENSPKLEFCLLKNGKLKYQKHFNDIFKAQYTPKSKYFPIKNVENTCQKNTNEIVEDENSSIPENNSLMNPVEYINDELCQQKCDVIVHDKDFIISKPNILNNELLTDHQPLNESVKDSTNIKMTELPEFNVKSNDDHSLKNTYSNGVKDIKLTRVKFTFKCNNKNVIKTNIFDRDPIVSFKKTSVLDEKYFITQNDFKKQNCIYKPWRRIFYEKKAIYKTKDNSLEDIEVRNPVTNTELFNIIRNIKSSDLDIEEKKDENIASLADSPFSNEQQCIEQSKKIIDDEIYSSDSAFDMNDDPYKSFICKESTPMPSPCNDFESDSQSSEHFGEEFWDKSLENEYKNVLRKTISKLPKNRVSIRDRFNTRLLARKVNEMKRKKRQKRGRRRSITTTTEPQTFDDHATIEAIKFPNTSVISQIYPTRYKIKVQLPWRRIFNFNDQSRTEDTCRGHSRDTKIELGPAKVEVRLSQTPGEWQVAACRSATSSKSVVSVKRLVLQRATTGDAVNVYDKCCTTINHCDNGNGSSKDGNSMPQKCSRKLPKIVIRRNGQDNNYTTSYVSSGGFEEGVKDVYESPRLIVRLVRDKNLDAMAAGGVTTLHLKHLVPMSTESVTDTHDAKRVRYA